MPRIIDEAEQTGRLVISIIGTEQDVATVTRTLLEMFPGLDTGSVPHPVRYDSDGRYSKVLVLEKPKHSTCN
jgi:hypothetical protein